MYRYMNWAIYFEATGASSTAIVAAAEEMRVDVSTGSSSLPPSIGSGPPVGPA
jgi:hypothetical protein